MWADYRLGDCIKDIDIVHGSCSGPPGSLAMKYYSKKKKKKDLKVLNKIVPKSPNEYDIILHLRIGDVIENAPESVHTFWSDYTKWKGKNIYVFPKQYWIEIINQLPKKKKIGLIFGGHGGINNMKSNDYVNKVKSLFQDYGYELINVGTDNPDEDFIKLCNAKIFIQSGGGYSAIAAKIVRMRKNKVLFISENIISRQKESKTKTCRVEFYENGPSPSPGLEKKGNSQFPFIGVLLIIFGIIMIICITIICLVFRG